MQTAARGTGRAVASAAAAVAAKPFRHARLAPLAPLARPRMRRPGEWRRLLSSERPPPEPSPSPNSNGGGHYQDPNRFSHAGAAAAVTLAVALLMEGDEGGGTALAAGAPMQRTSSMRRYPYVIVGSGTAAHAALEALRFGDPSAEILMIAEEIILPRHDADVAPGQRASPHGHGAGAPPLAAPAPTTPASASASAPAPTPAPTPAAHTPLESRLTEVFNEWRRQLSSGLETEGNSAVTLLKCDSFADVQIDVEAKTVTLQTPQRTRIAYEKCLLATSGKPREFYALDRQAMRFKHGHLDNVNMLHAPADFKNLCAAASDGATEHVTVVGGGFLGTEVVAALAEAGTCRVTHVLGEPTALAQYLPAYLSQHITARLVEDLGVETRGEALVTAIRSVPASSGASFSFSASPHPAAGGASAPAPAPAAAQAAAAGQPASAGAPAAAPNGGAGSVGGAAPALDMGSRRASQTRRTAATSSVSGPPPSKLSVSLVGAERLSLETDYVVLASTNVKPELVGLDTPGSVLEVAEGGIVTNASLQAFDGFFVAGNAATYYDPAIGRRRVDTYDHHVNSGILAAYNMMARNDWPSEGVTRYSHQPFFRSHLPGIGLTLHGLGRIDARLETVGVWFKEGYDCIDSPLPPASAAAGERPGGGGGLGSASISDGASLIESPGSPLVPSATTVLARSSGAGGDAFARPSMSLRRGIVYYLDRGRVVGILLCNAGEMLDQARDVLNHPHVVTAPVEEVPQLILLAPGHWLRIVVTK